MLKRLTVATGLSVALLFGVGATASAHGNDRTTDTFDVSFTMSSDHCSQLPDGVTVEGAGTMTVVVKSRTDPAGVNHLTIDARSTGEATDNQGNTYRFRYTNLYRTENTVGEPDVYRAGCSTGSH